MGGEGETSPRFFLTRLVDFNPLTGERITFRYNHADDTFTVEHSQDCTDIIEWNKRQQIEANHSRQRANDWVLAARVPNVVIMNWRTEHGVDFFNKDHDEKVKDLLNSPDYEYLRCIPGKI